MVLATGVYLSCLVLTSRSRFGAFISAQNSPSSFSAAPGHQPPAAGLDEPSWAPLRA